MLKHPIHLASRRHYGSPRAARGLSIVELLVGVAIGLIVVAGASALFVTNIISARQVLLEARINQDLRNTMDLITRDLRRGAYWGNSLSGTLIVGAATTTTANPYAGVSWTPGTSTLAYGYMDTTGNNAVASGLERFNIRQNGSAIQMNVAGTTWTNITNTDILTIPTGGLAITPTETSIDLRAACPRTCTDTLLAPTCPRVTVRTYDIVLTGTAVSNAALTRTLRSQVRVRNDAVVGTCPS